MKMKFLFALFLTLSVNAFSIPVTLESEWNSTRYGEGVLTFTYESDTPDENPSPLAGYYTNPILSLSLVFDTFTYNLDTSKPTSISLIAQQQSFQNIGIFGTAIGSDNQAYTMSFKLEVYDMVKSGTDALSQIEGSIGNETNAGMQSSSIWDHLYQRTEFSVVEPRAEVPEPSSIALMFAGIAGFVLTRRPLIRRA